MNCLSQILISIIEMILVNCIVYGRVDYQGFLVMNQYQLVRRYDYVDIAVHLIALVCCWLLPEMICFNQSINQGLFPYHIIEP